MIQELDDALKSKMARLKFDREQAWRNVKASQDARELGCESMWMHIAEDRDQQVEDFATQMDQVYELLERMGMRP